MSGCKNDWASRVPHPSLANEWNEFSKLSSQGPHDLRISKLCLRLLNPSVADGLINSAHKEAGCNTDQQLPASVTQSGEECSQLSQPLTQMKSQGFPYLSQSGEDHDVESLLTELNEALESRSTPLHEDLVTSLSELPQQAYPQLLQRLQEELTSEGLNTLCELVCEDVQGSLEQNTWLHPALICNFIVLPMVMNEGECSQEINSTLEEFARSCPKIVIVQVLQPLLLNEESVRVHSDLVRCVISAIPVEHQLHLIKFILEHCEAPLPVSKLNVFITVLGAITADLAVILNKLMALLDKSATLLAENEQFSNLLQIVLRKLPSNTPHSVLDRLANIVRQNKSFNKQLLLNALKEKNN